MESLTKNLNSKERAEELINRCLMSGNLYHDMNSSDEYINCINISKIICLEILKDETNISKIKYYEEVLKELHIILLNNLNSLKDDDKLTYWLKFSYLDRETNNIII